MVQGDGKSAKDDMDAEQGGQVDNSPADLHHEPVALAVRAVPRSLDLMVGSNYGNLLSVNDASHGAPSMVQGTMETAFEGETLYCNNIKSLLEPNYFKQITIYKFN